ncbi:hypothetical protein O181_078403 [Austropuccinia psidii MF-1]|uniref:Retrovirus-related Pol polyprotein from transposon TNT 1-94-like beta-barrel domain-containing protein n=1 Tax=Austropuccinia psidii MF-1 TaxID=1389203 RepID=A0A9Q3IEL8_9BASI|nr:hypothetical protein [Austropuccinia psidii MF-1]
MVSMGQADQQTGSQSVMKLLPKNQVPTKSNKVDALSSTMSNIFISSPSSQGLNQQIKLLHMPSENEIKQAQLNIKLGNRQPSELLQQKHAVECQYCKLQGLSFQGHWVSTFPVIREILKLEKAPPPMGGFEPAIRAVSDNRTACMVDTGSQVHMSGNSNFFVQMKPLKQILALSLASPSFNVYATHRGTVKLPFVSLVMNNVLYCHAISGTLILLGQLVEEVFKPRFTGQDMWVYNPQGELYFYSCFTARSCVISPLKPNMNLELNDQTMNDMKPQVIQALNVPKSFEWHCQLGNASDKIVKCFLKNYVPEFNLKNWLPFVCDHCLIAKSTRRNLPAHDDTPRE